MPDYVLEGPRWSSNTISWSLATTNYGGQPAAFGSYFPASSPFVTEIQQAFDAWAAVADLHFVKVNDSAGVNIRLGLQTFDGAYGTLADTDYYYTGSGANQRFLPDVLIRFDSAESYTFSNGEERLGSGVTFEAVALHEIGHALGLDHYTAGPAIMSPVASPSITSLQASDQHGIVALYGAAVAAQPPAPTSIPVMPATGMPNQLDDFNGDRFADVLWRKDDGHVNIWTSNGTNFTGHDYGVVGQDWHIQRAADFDGDGRADIVWRNDDGHVNLWTSTGSAFSTRDLGAVDGTWKIAQAGDVTGDGRADILWRNDGGRVDLWTSTGSGFSATPIGNADRSWHVEQTGDLDGDGRADILWMNDNGTLNVWTVSGNSVVGRDIGVVDRSWHIQDVADMNGDGRADIFWRNDNGSFDVWTSTGSGFVGKSFGKVDNAWGWHVEKAEDFNHDGKADVLWRNDNGAVSVWTSTGTDFQTHDYGIVDTGWHVMT